MSTSLQAATPNNAPSPTDLLTFARSLPPIVNTEGASAVVEFISGATELRDAITSHYEPVIKNAHAAHKAAVLALKQQLGDVETAILIARNLLADFGQEHKEAMPPRVQMRSAWTFRVVDASALPREFLCPDEDKLKAHVKAHGDGVPVPGVVFERKHTAAVKKAGAAAKDKEKPALGMSDLVDEE